MKSFYHYPFENHHILQTPNLWRTYKNYNYMIVHEGQAYLFDPGDFEPIQNTLVANRIQLKEIYLTHHHQDHVGATLEFKKKWNCPVFGFGKDQKRLPGLTHKFQEGDELSIAGLRTQVLYLPGHTLGLCAFYMPEKNWVFSNDLLFSLGCGRIFEGTPEQMFHSLRTLSQLPDDTWVFSSHEYTGSNLSFALSIFDKDPALLSICESLLKKIEQEIPTVPTQLGFEKEHNPFLRWSDATIRKTLGLEEAADWQVFAEIRRLKDMH